MGRVLARLWHPGALPRVTESPPTREPLPRDAKYRAQEHPKHQPEAV